MFEPVSHTEQEHARWEAGDGLLDEYAPAVLDKEDPWLFKRLPDVPVRDEGRHGTWEELREMKILAFECPLPGCSGKLEEDTFYCSHCGFVSVPGGARSDRREKRAA